MPTRYAATPIHVCLQLTTQAGVPHAGTRGERRKNEQACFWGRGEKEKQNSVHECPTGEREGAATVVENLRSKSLSPFIVLRRLIFKNIQNIYYGFYILNVYISKSVREC